MNPISTIDKLLKELEHQRFYGAVEFKFESGNVVLIRKTETIKPQDCRSNRGEQNDGVSKQQSNRE